MLRTNKRLFAGISGRRSVLLNAKMTELIKLTDREEALRQLLLDVSTYFAKASGEPIPQLRFTGGWVRDKLLGITSKDIDISISSMTGYRFGEVMKEFLDFQSNDAKYDQSIVGKLHKIEANPDKSKHLETLTTRVLGFEIDLVNLRKEAYVDESRNPIMEFGTPEDDANRRDATVNALFYNLQTSEVEDFTGRGLQDLQLKLLKTPLSPHETFKDDPLRILRCIRFASRLGYRIDPTDEEAMGDDSIKEALRVKISRERVGIEIVKMLQGVWLLTEFWDLLISSSGPNPYTALALIDRLKLYYTIFTNYKSSSGEMAETKSWKVAYQFLAMMTAKLKEVNDYTIIPIMFREEEALGPITLLSRILLREPSEVFLAWIVCCFIPYARSGKSDSSKFPRTLAAAAAREGIKTDNKTTKIIEEASLNFPDVIMTRRLIEIRTEIALLSSKQALQPSSREIYGKALLRWGVHWRSTVIFALLVEITEAKDDLGMYHTHRYIESLKLLIETAERQSLLKLYESWLSCLDSLSLLEVHRMAPLVDGGRISSALNVRPGPWMKKAVDIALGWQLRNPDVTSPKECIEEIIRRKQELGLG